MMQPTKIPYVSSEYISVTDTAKLIRQALKRAFPGQKFSVRSDSYSGGASIRVRYTDGPVSKAVEEVVGPFSGADFDGMVDLKTYNEHWLMPDGSVVTAHSGGQGSTRPEYVADPPSPNARLVHFGANFVFVNRDYSPEVEAAAEAEISEWLGFPFEPRRAYDVRVHGPFWPTRDGEPYEGTLSHTGGNGNGSWGTELVAGLLHYRDLRKAAA